MNQQTSSSHAFEKVQQVVLMTPKSPLEKKNRFQNKQNQPEADPDYWKNNYLSLEHIHQKIVKQLHEQLRDKNNDLRILKSQQNDQFESLVSQIDNNHILELKNNILSLNYRIQELIIQKQHYQLKQEEWLDQYKRLMKQIQRYSKQQKYRNNNKYKLANNENNECLSVKIQNMNQRQALDYIKLRLLQLNKSKKKSPSQHQQNFDTKSLRSAITSPTQVTQSPYRTKLNKILNLSFDLSLKAQLKNTVLQNSTKSEFNDSRGFNNTSCSFASQAKSAISKQSEKSQIKWINMRKELEVIKKDNKKLRQYLEMH